jgi:hypothetical protein
VRPRCWTVFSRPSAVRLWTPCTSKVQQTIRKDAQNVLARDFADCGLSPLQCSMTLARFTRRCGAVSFATQVSVASAVLFSVSIQKERGTPWTTHFFPLREAIQNALQEETLEPIQVATSSNCLSFQTLSQHFSRICIHCIHCATTAFTETSIQFSFHTQHSSTARKIISDVSLLLLKLERFLIYLPFAEWLCI